MEDGVTLKEEIIELIILDEEFRNWVLWATWRAQEHRLKEQIRHGRLEEGLDR